MRTRVLQEKNYAERMQNGVEPYLAAHAEEFYWERESGHPIHVLRYRAFRPRGVVVISHGFTENAEKYKEIVYYFIKEHFHVYLHNFRFHSIPHQKKPSAACPHRPVPR